VSLDSWSEGGKEGRKEGRRVGVLWNPSTVVFTKLIEAFREGRKVEKE